MIRFSEQFSDPWTKVGFIFYISSEFIPKTVRGADTVPVKIIGTGP